MTQIASPTEQGGYLVRSKSSVIQNEKEEEAKEKKNEVEEVEGKIEKKVIKLWPLFI